MTHWMCTTCGYHLQISAPPNKCPSCEQTCVFANVTCYLPGCEEQVDPVLMGNTLKLLKRVPEPTAKPKPALPSSEDIHLVDILKGLDEEQLRLFKSLGAIENYDANRTIFTEDAEARALYIVERGQIAVTTQLVGRVRLPVSMITAGYAFGWSALVPPYRYTASAAALLLSKVIAFEREALLSLMRANPQLGIIIMQNIAGIVSSRLRTMRLALAGMVR